MNNQIVYKVRMIENHLIIANQFMSFTIIYNGGQCLDSRDSKYYDYEIMLKELQRLLKQEAELIHKTMILRGEL